MKSPAVYFPAPNTVTFETVALGPEAPAPDQVLIETEASIVSPGTELAILAGKEGWAPLPYVPGYGGIGKVIALGSEVKGVALGDRIFTHSRHAAFAFSSNLIVPVPASLEPHEAAVARLGQIAMTALRIAQAQLGDYVVIVGLGAVGNLAAQLFNLAGCDVIATDLSPGRCAHAQAAGIRHTLVSSPQLREQVREITKGKMARTVVDATGSAAVVESTINLVGSLGEYILLGSPRDPHTTDLTRFLNHSHLWNPGCVTIKGAHEWRLPILPSTTGHYAYSMFENVETLFRLLQQKRLYLTPFISCRAPAPQAASIYAQLRERTDRYLTAIFDWHPKDELKNKP